MCVACVQTMTRFYSFRPLNVDIRVSGGSHVVVVLEFPVDVSKDVVLVYQQPRMLVPSVFTDTPLVYGHVPSRG